MRASDLLGLPVIDRSGRRLGVVADLRCGFDADPAGSLGRLRVQALVVRRRRIAGRLGYDRHRQPGPWLLRRLVLTVTGGTVVVPWARVADWQDQVRLDADAHALPTTES